MTFHDLIGAPYKIDGRGPEYDCAGLAIEMQARQGRVLHVPQSPDGRQSQHLSMLRIIRSEWRQVELPGAGCLVFFETETHVGTMLDRRRFLHTTSDVGSAHIGVLTDPLWRTKPRAFYVPR